MIKRIGIYGDSYAQPFKTWTECLARLMPDTQIDIEGKGGTNLFYAVSRWHDTHKGYPDDYYDVGVFTLTWHDRLYHSKFYRNEQFSCYSEHRDFVTDDAIHDEATNQEFLSTIPLYYKYIYDDKWALFNYELTIKYMLQDLTLAHPKTKFVFVPNTQLSRELAKRYFVRGVLLDFAFEELSNLEKDSPGPMPIRCGRHGHLGPENHDRFAALMQDIITVDQWQDRIIPIDLSMFDIVRPL